MKPHSRRDCQPGCRRILAPALLSALFLVAATAFADTIILKNGRRIIAESVTDDGERIFYEGGDGRVSIPKSVVERIEKDDSRPQSASQPAVRPAPAPPPGEKLAKELPIEIRVPRKDAEGVVRNGAVDEERLEALGRLAGNGDLERQSAVNSFLVAAGFEAQSKRFGQASRWAEESLRISGQDLNALVLASQIDIARQQYSEALSHLFLAQSLQPDSPEVLMLLGHAYYYLEGPEKANRYWKQSYALRADPKLAALILETDREEQVESKLTQNASSHFSLSREGSEISEAFSRQVLETLEQHYRDLQAALDFSPRESIVVILYPAQQFVDITRSPNWAGAVNDGKIRVPVRGLSSMTPALSQVLKHEMVHSFVHSVAPGRCPTWFNEGLAQLESGESAPMSRASLAKFYVDSKQLPLAQLEGTFMNLNNSLATIAYAESLAAVSMLKDRYGAFQLSQLLRTMGEGKTMAESLRQHFRSDYAELEAQLASYVAGR